MFFYMSGVKMDAGKDYENEIKELERQLKIAQRRIATLESDNNMLATFNKKATMLRDASEKELLLAKDRAERAGKAKGDFLASMSHEIRTPINAVLGMNELIMRESTEPQILEYAADIKSSGRMLLSIINDILDFSKIESGKMEIIEADYDLSSLINDVINMLSKRASDKGLEFIVKVDKTLPSVLHGDEIRIRQIIMNLLTNAVKYTETGSVTLSVEGIKGQEFKLLIRIIDTGKGIKPEDQEKLFDSFTRVDEVENRAIEGTGLGLALTKGFVDMMGGMLTVESTYGSGSIFSVFVKQGISNDEPIGDFEERVRQNRKKASGENHDIYAPGCKVLVVDDVEMNCKVICGLLKNSGMEIDTVLSGFEALERCQNKKYDLIFMDHRMPKMDGIECFKKIQQMDTENSDTPVIVLTANALSGMREKYMKEGFVDYLTKPIEVRKLEASLINVIPEFIKDRDEAGLTNANVVKEGTIGDTSNTGKLKEVIDKNNCGDTQKKVLADIFPELDVEMGLMYCMNSEEFYMDMLKEFAKGNRSNLLRETLANKNIPDFRTYIHGVKSTAASIGAKSISEKAKALEQAAKEDNVTYIENNIDAFLEEYASLIEHIERE